MLSSFTKRHGIKQKLLAHDIVQTAQEVLREYIRGTPLENDMLVVSYAEEVITFACRHAAARFDAEQIALQVCTQLESRFPAHTFRALWVVRPEAWKTF